MVYYLLLSLFVILALFKIQSALIVLPIIIFFSMLILEFFASKTATKIQSKNLDWRKKLFFVLITITIVGQIRSNFPDQGILNQYLKIISAGSILLFFYFGFGRLISNGIYAKDNARKIVFFLVLSLALYLAVSMFLYLIGIRAKGALDLGSNILMSFIGLDTGRVFFPLSEGVVNHGSIAGTVAVMAGVLLVLCNKPMWKLALFFSLILGLITIILVDSRTTVFNVFLTLVLIFLFSNRNATSYLKLLVWLTPCLPFLFVFVLNILADIPFFEQFARGSHDFETGNSRVFIWGISILEFIQFKMIHLFGWGEVGQFGSGISLQWAPIFKDKFEFPELTTPHNLILQILFNSGYLGVFVFLLTLWVGISQSIVIYKSQMKEGLCLLAFYVYFILTGITDSLFVFYSQVYFLYILVFLVTIITSTQPYVACIKEK